MLIVGLLLRLQYIFCVAQIKSGFHDNVDLLSGERRHYLLYYVLSYVLFII